MMSAGVCTDPQLQSGLSLFQPTCIWSANTTTFRILRVKGAPLVVCKRQGHLVHVKCVPLSEATVHWIPSIPACHGTRRFPLESTLRCEGTSKVPFQKSLGGLSDQRPSRYFGESPLRWFFLKVPPGSLIKYLEGTLHLRGSFTLEVLQNNVPRGTLTKAP